MPLVSYTEKAGTPMETGGVKITPLNRVLQISAPGLPVGLIWNRPNALLVVDKQGQEHRLPVTDVTRMAVWALLGLGLVFALLAQLSRHKR